MTLKDRLGRIRAKGSSDRSEASRSVKPRKLAATPPRVTAPGEGWERISEGVWERHSRAGIAFPPEIDIEPFLVRFGNVRRHRAPGRSLVDRASFAFFDLETTGLSGGAGTVPFLASIGRASEGQIETRQLFLSDYPFEPEFLEAVRAALPDDSIAVTYNGASFDLPLLETRLRMNRMATCSGLAIDLLPSARRLWRRALGAVTLADVERGVLGIERDGDIPGAAIPAAYFAFLSSGDTDDMRRAADHNLDDARSLARIMSMADEAFRGFPDDRVDRESLGRVLMAVGREEPARECLQIALEERGAVKAALILARLRRREGDASGAISALNEALPENDAQRWELAIEEARTREIGLGDSEGALEAALRARDLHALSPSRREIAHARAERLKRILGIR